MTKNRKIFLAIPCASSRVCVATLNSIVYDMVRLMQAGDTVRIFDECGHADIYLLRAQIVAHFLNTDYDELVFVDDDVTWPPGGLEKLLAHDVDLVAGAYPKRHYPLQFMFRSERENGADLEGSSESGLVEVWGMPSGFMRIRRHVLEKMVEHYREELEIHDAMVPGEKTVRLFDPYWHANADGKTATLSEDYSFCQRWRDIGGKVHMDVNIPMGHIGMHAFVGKLGEFKNERSQAA